VKLTGPFHFSGTLEKCTAQDFLDERPPALDAFLLSFAAVALDQIKVVRLQGADDPGITSDAASSSPSTVSAC
jgi:hypothetical protein